MQRVIIGTAGHIDHGKTTLLRALTGIDCDRWAEEKARGITIDLGFAHLEEDDLQIGFIDVPGHERFMHNALAGLGGIRLVLLVVAADEGVKPQTREHLAICQLLGIPRALVALTKADLVDGELLELAQLEVEELLETTPYAGSPILPVSSTTGSGLDALRQALADAARRAASSGDDGGARPFRLPVDRAFVLKGLGVVVTGTLVGGSTAPGESAEVHAPALRQPQTARVRSVQVHGRSRERALAGERTALQLTGVGLETVGRGAQLAAPGIFRGTRTLCARLTLLPEAPEAISGYAPVRFHLYSSEVVGRLRPLTGPLEPGAAGLVEIRLAAPVVAIRGDRFVVRRPSPATTLGGGEILDSHWRRRRGRLLHDALAAIADPERAILLWVLETGERGLAAAELSHRLGWRPEEVQAELDRRVADGKLLRVETGRGPRWLAPAVVERVLDRGRKLLGDYLTSDRLARGMPKAQFLNRLLPRRAQDMGEIFLRWLEREKILVLAGDVVNIPGRKAQLTDEESALAQTLLQRIEAAGLTPPSPAEIGEELGTKEQILAGVTRYLLERGKLVQLPTGLITSAAALETMRRELLASGWDTFSVPQFKERFDLSRKWAIPLLEHLDSSGTTRRLGDRRQIVRR